MNIGLLACGGEGWVGGIHYLLNLIRALRSLPAAQRPNLALVLPPGVERRHFSEVEGQIEFLECAAAPQLVARAQGLSPGLKRFLSRSLLSFKLGRRAKRWLELRVYRDIGLFLKRRDLDLLFPCLDTMGAEFPVPWAAWAWDFQHRYLPDFFAREQVRERDEIFARMGAEAPLVVTSSDTARADFRRFYPGHRAQLRVLRFHTAPLPEWYAPDARETCERYGVPERFFLVANQFWAHKNHEAVFEALRLLKARGIRPHVVCTGHTQDTRRPEHFGRLTEFLRRENLAAQVQVLGLIPRLDQIQLMRCALAVIQPSLFEGWSSVVEDARALGRPLFLSDLTVHREQDPPEAVFFAPRQADELAQVLSERHDRLPAGPDDEGERQTLASHRKLLLEYAREFLDIAREAGERWKQRR
jgi:glycosyltransferase involved in cell wall biosynthesis